MNRVAFTIFGLDIMWYGVLMASAMILCVLLALKEGKRVNISEDDILNLAIVSIPCGLIGARLYYVIFNWSWYSKHLSEILNFRGGGMAIHGALIGGILAGFIYTKIKKINFFKMADTVMIGIPLGQAIGRWGNYINGEAHGGPTSLPWGIMVNGVKVHPTFLYESLWNILGFIFLIILKHTNKLKTGQLTGTYFIWYSVGRFFIESLRQDSLMLFGILKQAQIISIILIIIGIIIIFVSRKNKKYCEE